MNIELLTTKTLQLFHEQIKIALRADDHNPSPEKDYGVRTYPDWRSFNQRIEKELDKRKVNFDPNII